MMKRGWMKCYKMAGRYGEPFAAKEFFFDIYLLSDREGSACRPLVVTHTMMAAATAGA